MSVTKTIVKERAASLLTEIEISLDEIADAQENTTDEKLLEILGSAYAVVEKAKDDVKAITHTLTMSVFLGLGQDKLDKMDLKIDLIKVGLLREQHVLEALIAERKEEIEEASAHKYGHAAPAA